MSDFQLLLSSLQDVIDPQTPQSEISKSFIRFQKEISLESFSLYPTRDDLVSPFRVLWQIFLEAARSPSTTVRLAVPRAVGWFLLKLTPYCPDQMISSFFQGIRHVRPDPFTSPIVIAVYLFLSRTVAPPFLPASFAFENVKHHFLIDSSTFSEHTVTAIDAFGHLGLAWMRELLQHFLANFPSVPSRHIVRALTALISYYPADFLKDVIRAIPDTNPSYLTIYASIFATGTFDLSGLDLRPLAERALMAVGGDKASSTDIDSGLQVLSAIPGIHVAVDGQSFVISVSITDITARVPQSNVFGRASFYLLPLSIDLLKPRDTDKGLLLRTKFVQLSKLAKSGDFETRSQIRAIFCQTLQKSWNDEVSAALRGLALCVNELDMNVGLLRELLAAPKQSWLHSLDLITLLEGLTISHIPESLCLEIIALLITFSLEKKAQLAE
jgi:hypothetical protein